MKTRVLCFAIALISFVAAMHTAAASPRTCANVFSQNIASASARLSLLERVKLASPRTSEQRDILDSVANSFSKQNLVERWQAKRLFTNLVLDLTNPYSFAFDLKAESKKLGVSVKSEIVSLASAFAMSVSPAQTIAFDQWTRSEAHALILYDLLSQRGLARYSEALAKLVETNVYFSDGHLEHGPPALLTYSFEKEGRKAEITDLYKVPGIEDSEWFKKSSEGRLKAIAEKALIKKRFLSASTVAPTDLKPSFLGGFSLEMTSRLMPVRSWEIAHKRYEFSLHRLMDQVKTVAHLFGETHSFHVHTVFELPKKYAHFREFRTWFKSLNDYLYLRGLEEGLHGSQLTGLMNLKEDVGRFSRSKQTFRANKPGDITRYSEKYYSAGLRGGFYGSASSPDFVKLGIELRDTTRDLAQLERVMVGLSDSLSRRSWEEDQESAPRFRLTTEPTATRKALLEAGVRLEYVDLFANAEPTVGLGLQRLELGQTFNYKTHSPESASSVLTERFVQARAAYVKNLLEIQDELDGFKAKGVRVDPEELSMAVCQSLTTWAKLARPSERFSF